MKLHPPKRREKKLLVFMSLTTQTHVYLLHCLNTGFCSFLCGVWSHIQTWQVPGWSESMDFVTSSVWSTSISQSPNTLSFCTNTHCVASLNSCSMFLLLLPFFPSFHFIKREKKKNPLPCFSLDTWLHPLPLSLLLLSDIWLISCSGALEAASSLCLGLWASWLS